LYFDVEKVRAGRDALHRKSDNPADYSSPDLAIEIDVSGPKVDRPLIDAAVGLVEVWRFDGQNLTIEYLQAEGSYVPAEANWFMPVRAEDVRRGLIDEDSTHGLAWERRLN
jgi:Uma2 family endonuclease